MRSALTCAPIRDADVLRTAGDDCRSFAGNAEAGIRTVRAVGSGDGSSLTDIWSTF
jgi:hypothetical protein